jgi:hypothetical protein
MLKRPETHVSDAIALKTLALKMMSIDMSSTGVVKPHSNVYSQLRAKSKPATRAHF